MEENKYIFGDYHDNSFVIILKRLLSNKEETKAKISINLILLRLFFDRDIYDRKKWINRNIDE